MRKLIVIAAIFGFVGLCAAVTGVFFQVSSARAQAKSEDVRFRAIAAAFSELEKAMSNGDYRKMHAESAPALRQGLSEAAFVARLEAFEKKHGRPKDSSVTIYGHRPKINFLGVQLGPKPEPVVRVGPNEQNKLQLELSGSGWAPVELDLEWDGDRLRIGRLKIEPAGDKLEIP